MTITSRTARRAALPKGSDAEAALAVDVTVRRAGVPMVRDVSFTLPTSAVLGIAGRNGAGKTTLIEGLVGMLPSEGTVALFGERIDRLPTHRRAALGIALVPQGRRLFPALSVADNLRAARINPPGPGPTIDEFDLFPGLSSLLNRPAGVLSGGQQQQVAIARALIRRPRLMFLDEPTEGLAPVLATSIVDTLAQLRDEGMSLLIAEQRPHLIENLCETFLVLDSGDVAVHDRPDAPAVRERFRTI